MTEAGRIRIKRAYEDRGPQDGCRVLVDRLWPRGVSKAQLGDARWMKDVAPSATLRKWFGHKPERWDAFRSRYLDELRGNTALDPLRELVASGAVTLVYSARDEVHNQAVVLAEFLCAERRAQGAAAPAGASSRGGDDPEHAEEVT